MHRPNNRNITPPLGIRRPRRIYFIAQVRVPRDSPHRRDLWDRCTRLLQQPMTPQPFSIRSVGGIRLLDDLAD